ncbi:MAG: translation factor GTPase family protein [Lentihominibacter sp.]|nr:translation factor GTPase family protein [Lentihominibacter sp.]
MSENKKLTIGILAHVDAGKTTLSEAILYKTGIIRNAGRVDNGDAFMDRDEQERRRGITIFTNQAEFRLPGAEFNPSQTEFNPPKSEPGRPGAKASQPGADVMLLDTPGHVDFSAEMERTLAVLDYAILVISGKEGVQGHTITLWKLLEKYSVPVFVFINKMDMEGTDREAILAELQTHLDSGCREIVAAGFENIAMCSEGLLEEYLEEGSLSRPSIAKAVKARQVFPCSFGSALKLQGIDEFLENLSLFTIGYWEGGARQGNPREGEPDFRVFRITRDKQGERLTHMKILMGTLKVRDTIQGEKINQIRIISGDSFRTVDEAGPGTVCAVTGPAELRAEKGFTQAVMSYGIILPPGTNVHETYNRLKQLEEEDPQLNLSWDEANREIQIKLMGQVQLEVLHEIILRRFGLDVQFGEGRIAYRETIKEPVECAGHYEPLRHYAEVHLALEPLPRGSGLAFDTEISSDELDTNWQRLIITHLMERDHPGTMTGAPVTDMKITITGGRAHDKHTEGGDFRQATYRAIRQGLRKSLAAGEMVLLEPWYEFELEVPGEMTGRAMSDIQRMGGRFDPPETLSPGATIIKGRAPVSEMKDYVAEVASYTKGYGHLSCSFAGYEECHNTPQVCGAAGYDPDRDTANPADSVFCSHGAGRIISWNEADDMMHVESCRRKDDPEPEAQTAGGHAKAGPAFANDKDLERIFERTFRKGEKKKRHIESREILSEETQGRRRKKVDMNLPECLLVDGYNIIFAWDELRELAKVSIDGAREALIELLANYQGCRKCRVIAVFDAYRVKGGRRHTEQHGNVTVVFTGEAETADTYIERTTFMMAGKGDPAGGDGAARTKYRVRVATSDRLEQMIIMGNDAQRISATDFRGEVEGVNEEIAEYIRGLQRKNRIENPNRLEIPGEGKKD